MDCKQDRELVMKKVIGYIQDGTFQVDQKIYSENRLANILGVHRSTVRETLVCLEMMGILEGYQGDGKYLKRFDLETEYSPLSLLLLLQQGSAKQIMQMRKIIEVGVVGICADSVSDHDLKKMAVCLNHMKSSNEFHIISENDIKFHVILAKATDNPILINFTCMLTGYMNYISVNNWKDVVCTEKKQIYGQLMNQHMDIYEGLLKRDKKEAVAAIARHLDYIDENLNVWDMS